MNSVKEQCNGVKSILYLSFEMEWKYQVEENVNTWVQVPQKTE